MRTPLESWAAKLGLRFVGSPEALRGRIEGELARRHAGTGSPLLECVRCGFAAPDAEEVASCPGCGVAFPRLAHEMEDEMAKEATVTPLNAKAQRRQDDKDKARAAEKELEATAKKKLADLEKKIDELKKGAGALEWDIGKLLLEIRQTDAWQASGHDTFNEYAEARFDFTRQTAVAFMRIAEVFARDEATVIPIGHLRLLVTVPDDEDRKKLAEQVKKSKPTFRELAATVKAKRAEAGLKTTRSGMEDTVHVNARVKTGVVAEGRWKKGRAKKDDAPKRIASWQLGGATFVLDDLGDDGFVVRVAGAAT